MGFTSLAAANPATWLPGRLPTHRPIRPDCDYNTPGWRGKKPHIYNSFNFFGAEVGIFQDNPQLPEPSQYQEISENVNIIFNVS